MFKFLLLCLFLWLLYYGYNKIPDFNGDGKFDIADIEALLVPGGMKSAIINSQPQQTKQVHVKLEEPKDEHPQPKPQPQQQMKIKGTGTGWFISEDYIITNHHVIENCENGKIFVQNKHMFNQAYKLPEKNNKYSKKELRDIDVLRSQKPSKYHAALQDKYSVRKGESVYYTGYPLAQYSFNESKVIDFDNTQQVRYGDGLRTKQSLKLSGEAKPGNSGSAVVNRYGNVVSVLFAGDADKKTVDTINLIYLRSVLNKNNVSYKAEDFKTIMTPAQIEKMTDNYTVMIACVE